MSRQHLLTPHLYGIVTIRVNDKKIKSDTFFCCALRCHYGIFTYSNGENSMKPYLEPDEAAQYCGLDTKYLMRLLRFDRGPAHTRQSPKKTLFTQTDLDSWMLTWTRYEGSK
jgi:hypothetical protein